MALWEAMVETAPPFGKAIRERGPAAIRVKSEASAAFPSVAYHWGLLVPDPDELHLVHVILAEVGDRFIVLDSDSAFASVLRQVDTARGRTVPPLTVCAEAIRTTSAVSQSVSRPVLYESPSTLNGLVLGELPLPTDLLAPPVVTRAGREWVVDAWFIESGRTTLYRCRYDPGSPSLRYEERRIIRWRGLPPEPH